MQCALCKTKECLMGKNCSVIKSGLEYSSKDLRSLQVSAWLEADSVKRTKLEEIVIYAKKMGHGKIGIAFCTDYDKEARMVYEILSRYFEVFSVCCKVCGFGKAEFGLRKCEGTGLEIACNPIGQAMTLNKEQTDLNLIVGLCMGHDIAFTANSEAPVSTPAERCAPSFSGRWSLPSTSPLSIDWADRLSRRTRCSAFTADNKAGTTSASLGIQAAVSSLIT